MEENQMECTEYAFRVSKRELYELHKNGVVTIQRIIDMNEPTQQIIEFHISMESSYSSTSGERPELDEDEFEGDEYDAIYEQKLIDLHTASKSN